MPALEGAGATWLEEPFAAHAYEAYAALARQCRTLRLAGGEAAHNTFMARHLLDFGRVGFIQIDCGCIGGIGPAKQVADHAVAKAATYVNHTFTSPLALSASLQPFAGLRDHRLCEFPVQPKPLATAFTRNGPVRGAAGEITAPDAPGLGTEIDWDGVRRYLVDTEIKVGGKLLYRTPTI